MPYWHLMSHEQISDSADSAALERGGGGMSVQRRERVRLEISREAARLFWQQGVAATSGEQIADAVGLSVRTLWRYFRNKESCAEPVVSQGVEWFVAMLRDWPAELSLEEHHRAVIAERRREAGTSRPVGSVLLAEMIELGKSEPAIRSAWLMACDRVEGEMVAVVAARLRRPVDEPEVRLYAAAATAAMRVVNEDFGAAMLANAADQLDIDSVAERLSWSVRAATGGVVGDPVEPGIRSRNRITRQRKESTS